MPTSRIRPAGAVAPGAKASRPSAKSARQRPAAKAKTATPGSPGAGTGEEAGLPAGSRSSDADSPSALIDARIADLGDWRGEMLSRLRALIKAADPGVVEEWKWRGTPVWSHDGLICTGETYRQVVKMTFAKGASVADPTGLFNSSLDGRVRRAIDFHEGDAPDEEALKALIRAAVALNGSGARG